MQVDLSGVQALIVHRMHRPISRHLLFRFDDFAGGRAFVGELAPRVGMADVDPAVTVDPVLGVGITFGGLGALGVAPDLLSQFDAVYKAGPQAAPLGDVPGSRSDPAGWWERRFTTRDVHFGYRDGISQPDVAWDDGPRRTGQLDFRRILLGYSTPEHSSAPGIGPA